MVSRKIYHRSVMASRKIYEGVSAAQPIDFITLDSIHATNDTSVSQLDAISVTSWNLLPTIGKTETIVVPGEYSVRRKLIFILNLCRLPGGMVTTTATDGLIGKSARAKAVAMDRDSRKRLPRSPNASREAWYIEGPLLIRLVG
jgi:hypothetical protein